MSNPWFRMYHEFAKDPAVQCLAFEDQRHYVILLCLKCDGTLDRNITKANRDRMVYRGLGLDPVAAEEAKRRLMEMDLIDKDWQPKGWEKRQFKSDLSTRRTRKYRKDKESGNVPETFQNRSGNGPETDTEAETETEAEGDTLPGIPAAPAGPAPCPHQKIIDLYHEVLPELPRVNKWEGARKDWLQARWRENPKRQNLDWWRKFFEAIRRSDFLMGRAPARTPDGAPFKARLAWIVKRENWIKIMDRQYHDA